MLVNRAPVLERHVRLALARIDAGDLLYFLDSHSPFFGDTGIDLVYVTRVTDRCLVVKKYDGEYQDLTNWLHRGREVYFRDILDLYIAHPLAPDGRIFHIVMRKD